MSYLAVGERDQALLPMLRALDAVDAALGQDSAYVPALFNRALILQRLFLTKSAAAAWSRYATADHDESWKAEAQAHRRALSHLEDSLASRFFAQRARDRTFMLLGQWGAAIESGDRSRAAGLLGQAVALTDSLGGVRDRSALMTVTWLRAQASRATVDPRVARGLVDLADGIALHDRGSYEAGESVLASAERSLREVGSPAARWAAFYRAACEANQAKFAVSDARLQRTIREATRHEPALVGKATWVRGVIQLRQGNYEYANRLYEEARSLFVVAGDAMNEAAVSFLLAEGYALAGQTAASEREAYTGLRGLAPFRRSRYLSNLLMGVASHARESRLRLATLDVLSEVLTVVEELRVPTTIAYVRRTRGADLAAAGDTIQAFSELDSAAAAAARASGTMGPRVAADVDLVRGRLLLHRDREAARRALDHAVTTYRTINAVNALPAAL
ncbi:MAG TPA: hypothetical protein VFZ21_20740, partial [Gemmatimonadaceae bacterium]|nr:hypothetical protein [Gemmatimonadaceae bacterium]